MNYAPQNINLSQVRQSWMGNDNPALMNGATVINLGGNYIRVPNILLQQLIYTNAVNQGRSDSVGDFLGFNRAQPENMPYSSYGAAQGRLDEYLEQNPQFARAAYADPQMQFQAEQQAKYDRLNQMQNDFKNQTFVEKRSNQGAMMGADPQQASSTLDVKDIPSFSSSFSASSGGKLISFEILGSIFLAFMLVILEYIKNAQLHS